MNSGEGGIRQQRPTNSPSKNLFPNELECLYKILGTNCVVKKKNFNNFLIKKKIFFKFLLDFSYSCCTNFTWQ
jgi:hypothetical protein